MCRITLAATMEELREMLTGLTSVTVYGKNAQMKNLIAYVLITLPPLSGLALASLLALLN